MTPIKNKNLKKLNGGFRNLLKLAAATLIFSVTALVQADINGFTIENAIIPQDEILSGGPSKDGIPALFDPKFISAKDAHYLDSSDRVIGIKFDGIAKAYPINILNWHEVVNDEINNTFFAVTFCPLCGTGMVFSSEVPGHQLTFGVSGLLYNSDVLLYDKNTNSLWSQILSKSVAGLMVNTNLELLPSVHTSWNNWLTNNPETLVLSRDTGYSRNYGRDPYSGYSTSKRLYFPAPSDSKEAKSFHPKETVFGLNINDTQRAYPFSELDKAGAKIHDNVGGVNVIINWNNASRSVTVMDELGNNIPGIQGFYFAWVAFFPDTSIFYF